MEFEKFVELLTKNNLLAFRDTIAKFIQPSIKITPKKTTEQKIKIGASKIGGKPDLPDDFKWPAHVTKGESITDQEIDEKLPAHLKSFAALIKKEAAKNEVVPFAFLAQLNLEEIKPFDKDNLLPKRGMIYFFMFSDDGDLPEQDYKNRSNWYKVWYFDGDKKKLKRREFPKGMPSGSKYKPCALTFQKEISLHYGVEKFLDDEQRSIFFRAFSPLNANTKMLGYADAIQHNEMEESCEQITNAKHYEQKNFQDPEKKQDELDKNALSWKLLLQLDSVEQADMSWGDCGKIYFWIKEQDLKEKNFDNTWFFIQYT